LKSRQRPTSNSQIPNGRFPPQNPPFLWELEIGSWELTCLSLRGASFEDGRLLDVANIVWCTGFHPGFSWLDLPVFGPNGDPTHARGIVESHPGLYFVGLHFLFAFSSTQVHGVGRDAERIASHVAAR